MHLPGLQARKEQADKLTGPSVHKPSGTAKMGITTLFICSPEMLHPNPQRNACSIQLRLSASSGNPGRSGNPIIVSTRQEE
jgi:hypothetical protein